MSVEAILQTKPFLMVPKPRCPVRLADRWANDEYEVLRCHRRMTAFDPDMPDRTSRESRFPENDPTPWAKFLHALDALADDWLSHIWKR